MHSRYSSEPTTLIEGVQIVAHALTNVKEKLLSEDKKTYFGIGARNYKMVG